MSEQNFFEMLRQAQKRNESRVCVGLDSDVFKLPGTIDFGIKVVSARSAITIFNKKIVDATKESASCFKPNLAFYVGIKDGMEALKETIAYIHGTTELPVILDAKLGDIGNTNSAYTWSYFGPRTSMDKISKDVLSEPEQVFTELNADAVTVQPYLGSQSLEPVLEWENKGIIVLCRTSNPGAGQFQDREVYDEVQDEMVPLYRFVARTVIRDWNYNGNCGLVVAATYPKEFAEIRYDSGENTLFLSPGPGHQKGSIEEAVQANKVNDEQGFVVYNSSRSIDFAYTKTDKFTEEEFAEAAGEAAENMRVKINELW